MVIFLILFIVVQASGDVCADEVYLKNGKVVQGNILNPQDQEQSVKVDVVEGGELIGAILLFDRSSIENIRVDGRFQGLTRRELTDKERAKLNAQALKRSNSDQEQKKDWLESIRSLFSKDKKAQDPDINDRLRQRAESEKKRLAAQEKEIAERKAYEAQKKQELQSESSGFKLDVPKINNFELDNKVPAGVIGSMGTD